MSVAAQSADLDYLHVADPAHFVDGSIFVTAGAVNPTSTIQALALYIGDQIKTNIETLFD